MLVYRSPSGPNARCPPLWFPYGSGTASRILRLEGTALAPFERNRATVFCPLRERVGDVEQPVARVVRMKGEPEQALLAAVGDPATNVEEHRPSGPI